MDNIAIDPSSPVPPFEQLRSQVAGLVARGELPAGSRLGTVRQTAVELGLAANTVARAYRELEADGVVVTRGRQGTFVRSAVLDGDPVPDAHAAAERFTHAVRALGLTRTEAVRLVEEHWA